MSIQIEHTGGPWHLNTTTIGGEPVGWEVVGRVRGSCDPICVGMLKADLPGESISGNIADASLISAAPELLEALKNAVQASDEYDPWWIEDARLAIEKAEGYFCNDCIERP